MTIEGELAVRLDCDGRRVRKVTVRSTRPFAAARALAGRAPDDAVRTAPRLFSVCAHAQGAAAATAIDAATGRCATEAALAAREHAVLLEAVEQYLWRLLIDWPQAAGRHADAAAVAAVRRAISPALAQAPVRAPAADVGIALESLVARHVFGVVPDDWLGIADLDALVRWAQSAGTLPATLLAGLLARRSPLPVVAAVRERHGNAVPARMVARLAELARLVLRIAGRAEGATAPRWVDGLALGANEGLGAVQTARGLLVHVAIVDGARVTAYRIVAPTEWNFHPAGPLVRGLEGADAEDEAALVRDARLAVQALDPCVACSVEVAHA